MGKKVLNWILGFFGLLGMAFVFAGVIKAHDDYWVGVIAAISGFVLLLLVIGVDYLCRRFSYRPRPLPLDKRWSKIKKAL